jgi:peroxiredoxin
MSQKKARATRHAVAAQTSTTGTRFWSSPKGFAVGAAVAAVIAASFVVPRLTRGETGSVSHAGMSTTGDGPAIGSAPRFRERDVLSGTTISSQTLRGQRTLLYFSEGVMCQSCLQQIRDIDEVAAAMAQRHIKLVSITPDTSGELRQAIGQYGIASAMISDNDRNMSEAFNMLGKGMHADTPGHAFVLIDGRGKVLWQRDYYQPPYRTMYVKPAELFEDIPS